MTRDEEDKARTREELVRAVEALGYPAEFGLVLAGELRGAKSMRRMASYLRQAQPSSPGYRQVSFANSLRPLVTSMIC